MTDADAPQEPRQASFGSRVAGALALSDAAFASVEHDRGALFQAGLVVVAAGVARGVGAFAVEGPIGVVGSTVVAVVAWLVCGVLIWGIGVRRFGYASDYPEVLRTVGFAAAPLLLLVLGALPLGAARPWFSAGIHLWAALALFVAVREALDVSAGRAAVVCALALLVIVTVVLIQGLLFIAWGALD